MIWYSVRKNYFFAGCSSDYALDPYLFLLLRTEAKDFKVWLHLFGDGRKGVLQPVWVTHGNRLEAS